MNDSQLDQLLKEAWIRPPPLPDSLTRGVWRDIENRSLEGPAGWLDRAVGLLALRSLKVALWAVALALGLLTGVLTSHHADPAEVYAFSINPVAPALFP